MPEQNQEEESKFEKIERALVARLQTHKDAEVRQMMLGFMLPLMRTMREEVFEAFEELQERLQDVEDDSLNGQALVLVAKAKDALLASSQAIDAMMVKHEYVKDGVFTDKVDEAIKQQLAGVQVATADWFRSYADFSSRNEEDDEDDEEDEEEEEAA